jgi:predicted deacetylase
MNTTLLQLAETLDRVERPLMFFLRDDDAGWEDARLYSLLDLVEKIRRPIDLAAIPSAIHKGLARELCDRIDSTAGQLRVHQHGYAHLNHQSEGRSGEFGSDRKVNRQRSDLVLGRSMLLDHFSDRLDSLFTPPWNRCSARTPKLLAELGFTGLSRDRGAPVQHELPELPIDVDWCKHYRNGGLQGVVHALQIAVSARQKDRGALGLMLHHAAMDSSELSRLSLLLSTLAEHPRVQWVSMKTLSETFTLNTSEIRSQDTGRYHEEAH